MFGHFALYLFTVLLIAGLLIAMHRWTTLEPKIKWVLTISIGTLVVLWLLIGAAGSQ